MPIGKLARLAVPYYKQYLLFAYSRFGFPASRALILEAEGSNPAARLWARHLNYVDHLKTHHPEFQRWSRLWTYSFYLPVISIVIVAYFSAIERSLFLALLAVIVAVALYGPLLFIRWRSVRVFREAWNLSETEV